MSKVVHNLGEIQKEMEKIAEMVIRDTTKEVLEKFKTQYILQYVYNSHNPPTVYDNPETDKTFMEAWEWTAIEKSATKISTTMFMNPRRMNHTTNSFFDNGDIGVGIHGSYGMGNEDARESMDEILNISGKRASGLQLGGKFVAPLRPVGYWNKFIEDYISGGQLKRIVDRHAKRYGLTIR